MAQWKENYFKKGFYKKLVDEFFESGFLQELGVPVSTYIQVAEYVEQQSKKHKEEKKTVNECVRYFKQLRKQNPDKYQKILDMMGWDEQKILGGK